MALVQYLHRDKEPTYQGRALSKWVAICTVETWRDRSWGTNTTAHLEAINAIRQIGTNALPLLLTLIDGPPRGLLQTGGDFFETLPDRITGTATMHWLRQLHPLRLRASDAMSLSEALGPIAAPVVPDLVQRLSANNWTGRKDLALYGLACIGPTPMATSAAPTYTKFLDDPDGKVQWAAAKALYRLAPELLTNAPAQ